MTLTRELAFRCEAARLFAGRGREMREHRPNNISMPRISFCVGVKSNAPQNRDDRFQDDQPLALCRVRQRATRGTTGRSNPFT